MSTTLDISDFEAMGTAIQGRTDAEILALAAATPGGLDAVLDGVMERWRASFKPEVAGRSRGVLGWNVKTPDGIRPYQLQVADGECALVQGGNAYARVVITISAPDFLRMLCGQLNLLVAFMKRRMKVKGDLKFVKDVGPWFGVLDRYTNV